MIRNIYSFSLALIIGVIAFGNKANAQLTVNGSMTPAQLVQNVLLGPGVTASNITYTGANVAIGFFDGLNSNIGLDSGIIMCSGDIANAPGPNVQGGITTANGTPGDPDLDNIMSPQVSFDAAVLEFDFIPTGDTVKFRYVFSSDEYAEYANTSINDGFGFFLTGVTTPFPTTNIALIPSTTTPVTINTINCQNNSPYYICNDPNNTLCPATYTCPSSSPGTTVEYDGFTVVLTAISPVICGETYHIKIAIADGSDQILDSGVFLEAGSFSSSTVNISTEFSYGGPNDSTLYEGCGDVCFTFVRGQGNIANSDTVLLNVAGSATPTVDYAPVLPPSVIFLPGQDSVTLCVSAVADAITEGIETITLDAQPVGTSVCVAGATTVVIYLADYIPMDVNITGNNLICPGGNAVLFSSLTGGVEPYAYTWVNNGSTDTTLFVTPTGTTTYTLNVTDACVSTPASATFTVNVLPALQMQPIADIVVCEGNNVSITPAITGGNPGYIYILTPLSGPDTLIMGGNGTATGTPTGTTTYELTVWDNCNTSITDQFSISVETACEVFVPNVFTPNGDSDNEHFVVTNLEKFPDSQLLVFNRWGNKIYESANYQNDWNAQGVPDGVYYFILTVSDGSLFKGFVTILR
jgi:gliding motility-associated-like protein